MNNWFEVRVKYEKIDERGALKKVNEPYLVDALTFTEAEARSIKELEPYLNGEFIISNISRVNYTDLFPFDDGDTWFKCKIAYVSIDEEKGVEKRKTSYVLVQANDVKHAWDNLTKAMSDSVVDYEINSIQETAIMDVFPFNAADIDLTDKNNDNFDKSKPETFDEEAFGECSCQRGNTIVRRTNSSWMPHKNTSRFFSEKSPNAHMFTCIHCHNRITDTFKKHML